MHTNLEEGQACHEVKGEQSHTHNLAMNCQNVQIAFVLG